MMCSHTLQAGYLELAQPPCWPCRLHPEVCTVDDSGIYLPPLAQGCHWSGFDGPMAWTHQTHQRALYCRIRTAHLPRKGS